MQGQVCLITGATDGIGKATAIELARRGFTVVMAALNAAKAEAVKREIAAATGNSNADYVIADLRSLTQVRQLSETFKERYSRLDVLVNNAGLFAPPYAITEDGYEVIYQVNYLSHFYLTQLLLDALRTSDQGRIINLSSSVYAAGKFDAQNPLGRKRSSSFGAYSDSKLFMLLFTIELAERLKGTRVTANAVHPGIVRTEMMLRASGLFKAVAYSALPFSVSPQKGAATSIYLATSADVKDISGKYFTRSRETAFKTAFNTPANRRLLWDISMRSLPLPATQGFVGADAWRQAQP